MEKVEILENYTMKNGMRRDMIKKMQWQMGKYAWRERLRDYNSLGLNVGTTFGTFTLESLHGHRKERHYHFRSHTAN
jgi:hypothetical protein